MAINLADYRSYLSPTEYDQLIAQQRQRLAELEQSLRTMSVAYPEDMIPFAHSLANVAGIQGLDQLMTQARHLENALLEKNPALAEQQRIACLEAFPSPVICENSSDRA